MIGSFYNFPIITDKLFVVYNACSGALVSFDLKDSGRIMEFLSDPSSMASDSLLYKQFCKNGFIVTSRESEIQRIQKRRYDHFRTEGVFASYIIAPTTRCNFSCSYCYQNMITDSDKTVMSKDVVEKLKEFIKTTSEKKEKIHITWYGGEPLLCMDIIDEINGFSMNALGDGNFTSSVLTNGFLISDETIIFLKRNKINGIQITIDGEESLHNSRRFTNNHEPTYERIMSNITRLVDEGFNLAIRVNIDKTNPKAHLDVMRHFAQKKIFNVDISPAITRYGDRKLVLDIEDYAKIRLEHLRTTKDMGFNSTEPYLFPNPTTCDFFDPQSYCIDPEGNLFRCLEDIGDKSSNIADKATIFDKETYENKAITNHKSWLDIPEECHDCRFLPLCTIGCPRENIHKSEFGFSTKCTMYKYCIEDYLMFLLEGMPDFANPTANKETN